jgi:hypothetical protein
MKMRFPADRRASWRQHFLAIARQVESAAGSSQDPSGTTGLHRPRVPGPRLSRRNRSDAAAY